MEKWPKEIKKMLEMKMLSQRKTIRQQGKFRDIDEIKIKMSLEKSNNEGRRSALVAQNKVSQ